MEPKARDILVETSNPDVLDRTVQHFASAVVGGGMPDGYARVGKAYVVRCFSNADFVAWAIKQQGYGKVVRICDGLYSDEKEGQSE